MDRTVSTHSSSFFLSLINYKYEPPHWPHSFSKWCCPMHISVSRGDADTSLNRQNVKGKLLLFSKSDIARTRTHKETNFFLSLIVFSLRCRTRTHPTHTEPSRMQLVICLSLLLLYSFFSSVVSGSSRSKKHSVVYSPFCQIVLFFRSFFI